MNEYRKTVASAQVLAETLEWLISRQEDTVKWAKDNREREAAAKEADNTNDADYYGKEAADYEAKADGYAALLVRLGKGVV